MEIYLEIEAYNGIQTVIVAKIPKVGSKRGREKEMNINKKKRFCVMMIK